MERCLGRGGKSSHEVDIGPPGDVANVETREGDDDSLCDNAGDKGCKWESLAI